MFGMGFFEMVVIAVVAIIFLGPEKLPQAIIDMVKFFKAVKKTINDTKQTIDRELHLSTLQQEASHYHQQFTSQIDTITRDIQLQEITDLFNKYKNSADSTAESLDSHFSSTHHISAHNQAPAKINHHSVKIAQPSSQNPPTKSTPPRKTLSSTSRRRSRNTALDSTQTNASKPFKPTPKSKKVDNA